MKSNCSNAHARGLSLFRRFSFTALKRIKSSVKAEYGADESCGSGKQRVAVSVEACGAESICRMPSTDVFEFHGALGIGKHYSGLTSV
jgi:hypothetical protein